MDRARITSVAASLAIALFFCAPAFAQTLQIGGEWAPIRSEDNFDNPAVGEYMGLPLSEEGLMRAEVWDASIQSELEYQCRPHTAAYLSRGPSPMRIIPEEDPQTKEIIAYHLRWRAGGDRVIYMNGRAHPSKNAPHRWEGFSTGRWEGDILVVTTTHIKEGYVRRNGAPHSDMATLTNYLIRRGEILTWVIVTYDPVYLTEPLIRSTEYRFRHTPQEVFPCWPLQEVDRPNGVIPHHLPPAGNPDLREFGERFEIPYEATRSGAPGMYPEYIEALRKRRGARQ